MLELKPDRCNEVNIRAIRREAETQKARQPLICNILKSKFQNMKAPFFLLAWFAGLLLGAFPFACSEQFPAAVVYHVLLRSGNVWSLFFVRLLPVVLTIILSRFGFYVLLPLILYEGFLLAFSLGAFCVVFEGVSIVLLCFCAVSLCWPVLLFLVIWRHIADDGLLF